jgi:hypothetical protein
MGITSEPVGAWVGEGLGLAPGSMLAPGSVGVASGFGVSPGPAVVTAPELELPEGPPGDATPVRPDGRGLDVLPGATARARKPAAPSRKTRKSSNTTMREAFKRGAPFGGA